MQPSKTSPDKNVIRTTKVFSWIVEDSGKRIQIHQGGTSSSKTYSILQYIYLIALKSPVNLLISIVAETSPALRRGAMRDFMAIIGVNYNEQQHNKSECTFKINNATIEFFSADQPHKLRGARRDILYINECNNVSKEIFNQLEVRTKKKVFLDFNPSQEFWAHELLRLRPDDCSFRISTYRDNQFLDDSIKASIESRITDDNWWKVYGLGQIGELEGRIMPAFEIVKRIPEGLETNGGMDFGFTNDPTVCVETGEQGDNLYINQLFYGRGMTNQVIVKEFERLGVPRDYIIYADCAEPKSIREIYDGGFHGIKKCIKPDEVFKIGIGYLSMYKKIYVTENSIDVIKDFRNCMWEKDITGQPLNRPQKTFKHSLDASIYSLTWKITPLSTTKGGNRTF